MYLEFTTTKQTNRVKQLHLKSHIASDELFLSKLANAFVAGKVTLLYTDAYGEERMITYTGDVKEV